MSLAYRSPLKIQLDVLYALVLREMQSRLGKSRAGFLWALFEPAAHLLVPVTLYGFVIKRSVPIQGVEYPVYLLYGFLSFLLFKNACLQTMDGVSTAGGVLGYRQVQLMDVFVARLVVSTLLECFLIIFLLAALALFGYTVLPDRPLELLCLIVLEVALGFGIGLILAAIVSFIPDLHVPIRIAFLPLYIISGVLFRISRFSHDILDWLSLNPLLHLVELCRSAAFRNFEPLPQITVLYPLAWMLASLGLGLALYRLRAINRVMI